MSSERFSLVDKTDKTIQCEEIRDNGEWITYGELVTVLNKLEASKEAWKNMCVSYVNTFSVLSMDCQIVQEAIWELEKELRYNYRCPLNDKADALLKDLNKKFDELNKHRIMDFKED